MTTMPETNCPTGCGRPRGSGKLMCGSCWHRLPATHKRAVLRTWGGLVRTAGDLLNPDVQTARAAYTTARDAAIASLIASPR
jgi:hypothetical protein